MYIRNSIKKLIIELDETLKIPKRFDQYVDKIKAGHKLIVKNKSLCHCDNCNYEFKSNNIKVKDIYKCPNCKQKLLVKTNRTCEFRQRDEFCILDRFENYWIVRAFDVETWYKEGKYNSHVCEYGRQIYNEYLSEKHELYNNNIVCTTSGKHIVHNSFLDSNWKINQSFYHTLGTYYKVFPYNLKKILKGTQWQYSQLWEFAKNYDYFCLISLLKNYKSSFEYLVKRKLYNLAFDSSSNNICEKIKEKYSTLKKFLPFIKRHNLSYSQFCALDYTQKKDIKIINQLSSIRINFDELKDVNVDYNYLIENIDVIDEYIDYLRMCKQAQYNLKDKKIKYPKNILEEHDKLVDLCEELENIEYEFSINKKSKKLSQKKYQNKKYKIYPVSSVKELIDESRQQNNCVKTYARRIAEDECDIYFMRLVDNPNKSLVTVEVRNNTIVQKRTKNNERTTPEQDKFLNLWERKILGGKI